MSILARLSSFADTLRPLSAILDTDANALQSCYERFRAERLHEMCGARLPLSGREFAEALEILSQVSGAFAFVVLQQMVANMRLADTGEKEWPVVGVAFGHLRNAAGPAPVWDGKTVTGFVPWLTGANLFPSVILGVRTVEGEEIFARVDARNRPEFRHSELLHLIACTGTDTITVQIEKMPLSEAEVLQRQPHGTMAEGDSHGVVFQTPLMLGCARACLFLITDSSRVDSVQKQRCARIVEEQIEITFDAFSGVDGLTGRRLRAQMGDLTVRLARLAVMASGGAGLQTGHPAERLYREALLYSLMAQTDYIVRDAFEEVFA